MHARAAIHRTRANQKGPGVWGHPRPSPFNVFRAADQRCLTRARIPRCRVDLFGRPMDDSGRVGLPARIANVPIPRARRALGRCPGGLQAVVGRRPSGAGAGSRGFSRGLAAVAGRVGSRRHRGRPSATWAPPRPSRGLLGRLAQLRRKDPDDLAGYLQDRLVARALPQLDRRLARGGPEHPGGDLLRLARPLADPPALS